MNAELLALEQLGERDMSFIVSALIPDPDDRVRVARLARSEPKALEAMLSDERLAKRVTSEGDILLRISPYLFFAVLLRQVHRDLNKSKFTPEWSAPRARVPVFDAPVLAALLASVELRHYLAEMLASFVSMETENTENYVTGAAAGMFDEWRGNQLDFEALIRLGAQSPHAQRLAVFRRVGDVALLLTGIFPDYAARHGLLGRRNGGGRFNGGYRGGGSRPLPAGRGDGGPTAEIEEIGKRYYRMAARHPNANWLGWQDLLNKLAAEFTGLRKILNFLSDSYIHPVRCHWFPDPS